MSHEQIAGQNYNLKTGSKSFETVVQIIWEQLEQVKIVFRKKLGADQSRNTCCNLVHSILSSSLLAKNVKIKIYRIIISPVGLYGFETWSLTLREGGQEYSAEEDI